jgi:AraC-like DNA-binding protein
MISPFSLFDASLKIKIIGYFPCKSDWKIPLAKAKNDCLFFIEKGSGWVEFEGERVETKPGDLHLFKRNRFYELGHDPENRLHVYSVLFYFDQPNEKKPFDWLPLSHTYQLNANDQKIVIEMYKKMITFFNDGNAASDLKAKAILFEYIAKVIEWEKHLPANQKQGFNNLNNKSDSRIHDAIAYIYNNMSSPVTVTDLAQVCHLTTSHFTKLFKAETNENPKDYIRNVKINHAKSLMYSTDKQINQIARAVGIEDPFYFARAFKQLTSLTPSDYKKSLKAPNF